MWTPGGQLDLLTFAGLRGGGKTTTSSSTSQVTLPQWVSDASQSNYQQATDVAARDYQANPYSQVAGLTPDQQQAFAQIQQLQGQANPAYNQAEAVSSGLLTQAAPITAGQISGTAGQLMNPYTMATVAPTVEQMRQDLAQQQNQIAAQASNVGAYGGSRQGIEQGTAQAQEAIGEGKLVGGLLQSGYDTASQQAMQMAQQNQALGAQQISQLPQLATAQETEAQKEAGLLEQSGATQQQQQQNVLDTAASNWQTQWNYPLEQLAIEEGALSSSPYGYTTTSTGSQTASGNLFGDIMGGVSTGVGLLGLASKL